MTDNKEVEELTGIYDKLNSENKKKIVLSANIFLEGQKIFKEENISKKRGYQTNSHFESQK